MKKFLLLAVLIFAGCGGSSSGGGGGKDLALINVKVIDGVISGAEVCTAGLGFDCQEKLGLTDENGALSFKWKDEFAGKRLVAKGGIDLDTGDAFSAELLSLPLDATQTQVNITPLTYLAGFGRGSSLERALGLSGAQLQADTLLDLVAYKKAFALQKVLEIAAKKDGKALSALYEDLSAKLPGAQTLEAALDALGARGGLYAQIADLDVKNEQERLGLVRYVSAKLKTGVDFVVSKDEIKRFNTPPQMKDKAVEATAYAGIESDFYDLTKNAQDLVSAASFYGSFVISGGNESGLFSVVSRSGRDFLHVKSSAQKGVYNLKLKAKTTQGLSQNDVTFKVNVKDLPKMKDAELEFAKGDKWRIYYKTDADKKWIDLFGGSLSEADFKAAALVFDGASDAYEVKPEANSQTGRVFYNIVQKDPSAQPASQTIQVKAKLASGTDLGSATLTIKAKAQEPSGGAGETGGNEKTYTLKKEVPIDFAKGDEWRFYFEKNSNQKWVNVFDSSIKQEEFTEAKFVFEMTSGANYEIFSKKHEDSNDVFYYIKQKDPSQEPKTETITVKVKQGGKDLGTVKVIIKPKIEEDEDNDLDDLFGSYNPMFKYGWLAPIFS